MSIFYRPGQVWALPRITKIQETIAEAFELHISSMVTKARPRHLAHPRQVAMFFSRELTKYSLEEIGRCFGGRDHGTVIHAINAVKREAETEPDFAEDLKRLRLLCVTAIGQGGFSPVRPSQAPVSALIAR